MCWEERGQTSGAKNDAIAREPLRFNGVPLHRNDVSLILYYRLSRVVLTDPIVKNKKNTGEFEVDVALGRRLLATMARPQTLHGYY